MPTDLFGFPRYKSHEHEILSDSPSNINENQLTVLDQRIKIIKGEINALRNILSSNIETEITEAQQHLLDLLQKLDNELKSVILMYSQLVNKNDFTEVQKIITTIQNEVQFIKNQFITNTAAQDLVDNLNKKLTELQNTFNDLQIAVNVLENALQNNPSQEDLQKMQELFRFYKMNLKLLRMKQIHCVMI